MQLDNNDMFVFTLLVIVIIIIIQMAPDFQTGILRVSVLVYAVMLYRHVCKIRDGGKDKRGDKCNDKRSGCDDKCDDGNNGVQKDISSMMSDLSDVGVDMGDSPDLSVPVDAVDDSDLNVDTSEDDKSKTDDEMNKARLRELLHNDHYNPEGRIYHTAKNRYTTCHPPPSYEIDKCQMYDKTTFDEENSRQQRERNRNKRSIDGMVSKTADYYRIHYAREFEKEEAKHGWWGNYNYGYTEY